MVAMAGGKGESRVVKPPPPRCCEAVQDKELPMRPYSLSGLYRSHPLISGLDCVYVYGVLCVRVLCVRVCCVRCVVFVSVRVLCVCRDKSACATIA